MVAEAATGSYSVYRSVVASASKERRAREMFLSVFSCLAVKHSLKRDVQILTAMVKDFSFNRTAESLSEIKTMSHHPVSFQNHVISRDFRKLLNSVRLHGFLLPILDQLGENG